MIRIYLLMQQRCTSLQCDRRRSELLPDPIWFLNHALPRSNVQLSLLMLWLSSKRLLVASKRLCSVCLRILEHCNEYIIISIPRGHFRRIRKILVLLGIIDLEDLK